MWVGVACVQRHNVRAVCAVLCCVCCVCFAQVAIGTLLEAMYPELATNNVEKALRCQVSPPPLPGWCALRCQGCDAEGRGGVRLCWLGTPSHGASVHSAPPRAPHAGAHRTPAFS